MKILQPKIESIKKNYEEMDVQEFARYLIESANNEAIEICWDGWEYVENFARRLIERMRENLDEGNWFHYEIAALNALGNIPGGEDDIVAINAYGYPVELHNNDYVLYTFGLSEINMLDD